MDWTKRSSEKEELDDLDFSGEALTKSLDELAWVHKYLGGHQITVRTIRKAIKKLDIKGNRAIRILDAGCGGGESLRSIAQWAAKRNVNVELVGVDGNGASIDYAREKSENYPNIRFQTANFLKDGFHWEYFDIVLFSLVLHHFSNQEICRILKDCAEAAVPIIGINDLHRHPWAFRLFAIVTPLIGFSRISREDGLLSIRKAFRKNELEDLLNKSGYEDHDIHWQWAFRFEAIAQLKEG